MQNKDYQKLRECPFCGRLEPRLQERYVQGTANRKHYRYECPACHGTRNTWYRSIGKAHSGWNRRAQHMPAIDTVEVVRCRDCVHFGECLVTENDYCSKGERKETD